MEDTLSRVTRDTQKDLIEGRNIVTYFGSLAIFKERTKIISYCRPRTKHQITYSIRRNILQKLVKESFELDHFEGTLNPNEDFKLAITYKPTIPNLKNVEIFEYVDSDFEIIKIKVKGKALGPHCSASTKRILFYKSPHKHILEGKVEILNDSLASAHIKIDNIDGDIFKITPLEAIIEPGAYQLISVKFCPNKEGLFFRKMYCLVWNSEPLIVDLIAYYGDSFCNLESGLKSYNFPAELTHGFGAYFIDILTTGSKPFSLSSNNLIFGSVQLDRKGAKKQVTSLANHTGKNISVKWEKGTQIFKIDPEKARIPPNASVQFEVEFYPDENYNIFSETLVAQIYWKFERSSIFEEQRRTLPMFCTLNAQGHSFPENEGWITHVEVHPEVVYWQPCLPGQTVATTFLLQNKTHLPVMYQLVPPKNSNFTAKPMMGKFRNFDIIAVQIHTAKNKIKTYLEEWKIIINERQEKQISLYFHGETSIPSIEIGHKNKINCGNIQEGSRKSMTVEMTNNSFFIIRFKFRMMDRTMVTIDPMEGIIQGNEATKLDIKIIGNPCAQKTEHFVCEMNIIEANGAISGETYEAMIEIISECSYSQLCATPSGKNFGNMQFGKKIVEEFQAVNFGDSPIFFQACQCGEDEHDLHFRIKPCFGVIQPRDTKRFVITGKISLIGQQTLYFGYYNRVASNSPIVAGNSVTLFTLEYCSEFPVIQIDEIVEHSFGPLFGKNHLSEDYLKIDRFNNTLREILNDQTEEIHLRVPEFEVQNKVFSIILALNNISPYETSIALKRKQTCDCKLVEKADDTNFTQRKKGFDCIHREMLSMEIEDPNFCADTTRFLTIKVKYNLPKTTDMCYIMELSNHRKIEIYFHIFGIPPSHPRLSFYTEMFRMDLQNIYLGTRVAPVQTFWMYNNTKNIVDFEFDTTEVEYLCKAEGFKVLEILNPKDQILPYNSKALLVKFIPIEVKVYTVEICVKYQNPRKPAKKLKFVIEGSGDMEIHRGRMKEYSSRVSKYCTTYPVSLSIDCLERKIMPVWNKRKALIFIKSNQKNKTIQYIWGTAKIKDVIEVSVEREYGILEPKEIHPVVIVIKSFAEPCITNLLLPCEVVNYTDSVLHRLTKEKHKEIEKKIENEFTLSEGSKIERPENPIIVHPKPETHNITLILSFTTIHTKDLDSNMDPSIQLKQFPDQSLENIPRSLLKKYYPENYKVLSYPEKGKAPTVDYKQRTIFCRILEEAIADVVYSEKFKEYLKISSNAPPHYYTEFVMDNQEIMSKKRVKTHLTNEDIAYYRKKEIEKFFAQPKITEMSNILQNLIYESILKITQCCNPEFSIKQIDEQIESTLYNCKGKSCACNKNE